MKRRTKKDKPVPILSRFFSAILVVVFFTVSVLSTVALSYFVVTSNNVNGNTGSQHPGCLLFATGDDNLNQSAGATCGFVIWGHAVIMILCLLSIAYLIFKIVAGIKL